MSGSWRRFALKTNWFNPDFGLQWTRERENVVTNTKNFNERTGIEHLETYFTRGHRQKIPFEFRFNLLIFFLPKRTEKLHNCLNFGAKRKKKLKLEGTEFLFCSNFTRVNKNKEAITDATLAKFFLIFWSILLQLVFEFYEFSAFLFSIML